MTQTFHQNLYKRPHKSRLWFGNIWLMSCFFLHTVVPANIRSRHADVFLFIWHFPLEQKQIQLETLHESLSFCQFISEKSKKFKAVYELWVSMQTAAMWLASEHTTFHECLDPGFWFGPISWLCKSPIPYVLQGFDLRIGLVAPNPSRTKDMTLSFWMSDWDPN